MNNKKRERLQKAVTLIHSAYEIVENVVDEENDAADNVPENLQSSERYEKIASAIEYMEDANSNLEDALENIENALL